MLRDFLLIATWVPGDATYTHERYLYIVSESPANLPGGFS